MTQVKKFNFDFNLKFQPLFFNSSNLWKFSEKNIFHMETDKKFEKIFTKYILLLCKKIFIKKCDTLHQCLMVIYFNKNFLKKEYVGFSEILTIKDIQTIIDLIHCKSDFIHIQEKVYLNGILWMENVLILLRENPIVRISIIDCEFLFLLKKIHYFRNKVFQKQFYVTYGMVFIQNLVKGYQLKDKQSLLSLDKKWLNLDKKKNEIVLQLIKNDMCRHYISSDNIAILFKSRHFIYTWFYKICINLVLEKKWTIEEFYKNICLLWYSF